ncbi:hypothetical protein [Corynebacterium kalidii]|uniref:Uncharacterized protein n=1 Tax=Corynebacterium kalidii TaxID=2931982 RepID=A0A9X1WK14_9CORY|nr:hypothetical protein [Corynebacterium kalidii]MCJ7857792.1 hypothetical protein [Corynebacterium kalidii]
MNARLMYQRIADESDPPVVFGRLPVDGYEPHVLLDDLVTAESWLTRDVKEWFLGMWIDEGFDMDDPYDVDALENVRKFAAMDPVVDLETLTDQG